MSHLDDLRAAVTAPQPVWVQFTTAYRADRFDTYLFVEGRDDVTYLLPLVRSLSKTCTGRVFPCWSKDGVLQALKDITEKSSYARRCGFVVDKDLDDVVGVRQTQDSRLLVTDHYSLESYLASEACAEVIWTDIWCMAAGDQRLQAIKTLCRKSQASLWSSALPVMAWILWHRRRNEKLHLNRTSAKKLFEIKQDGAVFRTSHCLAELRKAAADASKSPSMVELLQEARALMTMSGKARTRGKYELSIFVRVLRKALDAIQPAKGVAGGTPLQNTPLTEANCISLVAGKIAYPEIFVDFVARIASDV